MLWAVDSFQLPPLHGLEPEELLAAHITLGFLHCSFLLCGRFKEIKVIKIQCKILMYDTAKLFQECKVPFLLTASGWKADVRGFAFWDHFGGVTVSYPSIPWSCSGGTVCISSFQFIESMENCLTYAVRKKVTWTPHIERYIQNRKGGVTRIIHISGCSSCSLPFSTLWAVMYLLCISGDFNHQNSLCIPE